MSVVKDTLSSRCVGGWGAEEPGSQILEEKSKKQLLLVGATLVTEKFIGLEHAHYTPPTSPAYCSLAKVL